MAVPRPLKILIGQMAETLAPDLVREFEAGERPERLAKIKSAIAEARLHRAQKTGDWDGLQSVFSATWRGGFGNTYHGGKIAAGLPYMLEHHGAALEMIAGLLASGRYRRVVEIGCGDGRVLCHVASKAPDGIEFVGIDLNEIAIADAEKLGGGRMEIRFLVGDGAEWLAGNPAPGTLLLTNGGVLEYFSPASIGGLLAALGASAPVAVLMIEPLAPGHDFETSPDSRLFDYSIERTFSHNYPRLTEEAGFVTYRSEQIWARDVRWLMHSAELAAASEI